MGRPSYVCTVCSEHFTRKYSGKRHNHNLHNGAAEIVRLIDYLAGRSSGQYTVNNPFWYKPNNPYRDFGPATVADSIGDAFQPRYISRQPLLGKQQYSASPTYTAKQITDDQRYLGGLSQDTLVKIQQLKIMLNRYPQFFPNPNQILTWTIHWAVNGDNKILDENLEQLRYVDSLANAKF